MKVRVVTVLILLLSCNGLFADTDPPATEFGTGISGPIGSLGNECTLGFHGRLALAFRGSIRAQTQTQVGFVLEISFHSFSYKSSSRQNSSGALSTVLVGVGPRVLFGNRRSQPHYFVEFICGLAAEQATKFSSTPGIDQPVLYVSPTLGIELSRKFIISIAYVRIGFLGTPATFLPLTFSIVL